MDDLIFKPDKTKLQAVKERRIKKWEKLCEENNKRYCSVKESLENSLIQIKEYKENKREFKSLAESRKMWQEWAKDKK